MVKISTEGRMDFDNSVTTEDRFALRNWFEQLVEAINYNDRGVYSGKLADGLVVEGFTEQPLDRSGYLAFLESRFKQKIIRVIRFPELRIKYDRYSFNLSGTYEEFIDGILSYEGTIDLVVVPYEETFILRSVKFYPRLMLIQYFNDNETAKL